MKRLLLALALFAGFAHADAQTLSCPNGAASVTLTCGAAPPPTCPPPQPGTSSVACPSGQTGTITTSYSCVGVTWTPATVNNCTSAPPGGVEMRTLPPAGATGQAAIETNLVQNTTYAFALPLGKGGSISVTPEGGPPLMGTNAGWEVSITTTPGDWATAKTMGATENPKDHTWNTPYYAKQGGESGGLGWTFNGALPSINSAQWYFNLRIITPTVPNSNAIYVQPALT